MGCSFDASDTAIASKGSKVDPLAYIPMYISDIPMTYLCMYAYASDFEQDLWGIPDTGAASR